MARLRVMTKLGVPMIYILMNITAILAATLAGLVVGLAWLRAGTPRTGVPGDSGRGVFIWVSIALLEFWIASILAGALILAPSQAGRWTMALGSAVVIWIGFVAPAIVATALYRGLSLRTAFSDCAHWLTVMLTQAAVLRLFELRASVVV
jgi:hypothetical protein